MERYSKATIYNFLYALHVKQPICHWIYMRKYCHKNLVLQKAYVSANEKAYFVSLIILLQFYG